MLYLGHVIGDGRMSVPEARISAMRNYRRPAGFDTGFLTRGGGET